MEIMVSIEESTSCSFIVCVLIGESMNGTGSCWRGASRQIWVATSTSPASLSPFEAISTSVATQANVAVAPSASDARSDSLEGAPMAPNRPIMPSVLLAPPFFS